jgi:D-mannonate dehydratase
MTDFLFNKMIPHFNDNLKRKHWFPKDLVRRGNAIRKAKNMIANSELVVEPTENSGIFKVVQSGNQNSTHLVDAAAETCDCHAHFDLGKICYHKVAVELHQKGRNKEKKNNHF